MNSLLVVYSYHHHNTEKIAAAIAKVLDAPVKTPGEIKPEELQEYDLVGFGSGIYAAQHHLRLLNLADALPRVADRKAFLFSTCAMQDKDKTAKDHSKLREKLQSKGYAIVGEFSSLGFNTNSFMRYLGGMNRGRPNSEDLGHAEEFARDLKRKAEQVADKM